MTHTTALIIVDVQNDFTEGGALGVDGGNQVAVNVRDMLLKTRDLYDMVITTQDWHVEPGNHWSDTPDFTGTWPVHCKAGTPGAEYHPELEVGLKALHNNYTRIFKGEYEAAYSGFEGLTEDRVTLQEVLERNDVKDVIIVGIATEHCVKATVEDALKGGFRVHVLTDCVAGVDPEKAAEALEEFKNAGVQLLTGRP